MRLRVRHRRGAGKRSLFSKGVRMRMMMMVCLGKLSYVERFLCGGGRGVSHEAAAEEVTETQAELVQVRDNRNWQGGYHTTSPPVRHGSGRRSRRGWRTTCGTLRCPGNQPQLLPWGPNKQSTLQPTTQPLHHLITTSASHSVSSHK
jgi:hypothetical protein